MKITLIDTNDSVIEAFKALALPEGIDIASAKGDITKTTKCDAVVSPANSFGWMDGGVDAAYMKRFPGIEAKVMAAIAERPIKELLVGEAIAVETGDAKIKTLIVAPTMRLIGQLPIADNIMLAARAAVLCAIEAGVKHLGIPGLGAGTGQVDPNTVVLGIVAGVAAAQGTPLSFGYGHPFYQRAEGVYR